MKAACGTRLERSGLLRISRKFPKVPNRENALGAKFWPGQTLRAGSLKRVGKLKGRPDAADQKDDGGAEDAAGGVLGVNRATG